MLAELSGMKMEEQNSVKLFPGEKLYTPEQIQKDFFPQHLIGKRLKFYSEVPGKVVHVVGQSIPLPVAVKIKDGNGYAIVSTALIGGGDVKFVGHEYVTENVLEQKALKAIKKIVCMGEVKTAPNIEDLIGSRKK